MNEPRQQQLESARVNAQDTAAPASNTAASVVYAAAQNVTHLCSGVAWSYAGSGTLAGGNLQVLDGATVVFQVDITAQGPGVIPFVPEKEATPGNALTITLAAGGSNVSGKVNALGHRIKASTPVGTVPSYDFTQPANSMYL